MKNFFLISFFSIFIFYSCSNTSNQQAAENDSAKIDSANKASTFAVLNTISTENLFRFFSSNFHVIGNNPCMYYDSTSDQYVICGKTLYKRMSADNRKDVMAYFHEFLCDRGYSPDGDTAKDEYQKAEMNGKEVYVVSMDDLLPQMKPEERALFNEQQYNTMMQTAGSDAFHYLGNERNCPLIYASSSGLTIEGKKISKEIKMENARTALTAFGDYVDSLRKK
ncbi:MAG TPA: hypothetical protein VFJ43_13135 [Bacteroidia bacterium]|nr:hypothetical protein [Bacteroidia bacterium]